MEKSTYFQSVFENKEHVGLLVKLVSGFSADTVYGLKTPTYFKIL